MISCYRCLSYLSPMSHLILNLSGLRFFTFLGLEIILFGLRRLSSRICCITLGFRLFLVFPTVKGKSLTATSFTVSSIHQWSPDTAKKQCLAAEPKSQLCQLQLEFNPTCTQLRPSRVRWCLQPLLLTSVQPGLHLQNTSVRKRC